MSFKSLRLPSFFSRSHTYLKVEKGDDEGSETSCLAASSQPTRNYLRCFIISSLCNVLLAIAIFALFIFEFSMPWRNLTPQAVTRAASSFSPLFDKLPLTTFLKMINGSFMSETDPPDIFRALPSPEVDTAWYPISKPTWITITEPEARSLDKDPSLLVKAPEDWGHGKNKYIAMLDLNHQLHCLNQLRRLAFRDEYPIATTRMDFHKEHWMHCVHILYQNIMCTGSTEIITYNWRETQRFPVPDFDVPKKCRNTNALLKFQERGIIVGMDELREEMEKPGDAVTLPLPPRLKSFLEAHEDE
ncbi:hypothetical protein LSUE1_G005404 [Lachnellula suecica]|uniref:Tat pathway signal sequence protein n=1 Tax=Lachnellula suecica TaxID=602035 RepID=A0A8T9C4G5_9HELO|nr:hypothetical protein LSUE1_G005404 [Lachnellula suecica]